MRGARELQQHFQALPIAFEAAQMRLRLRQCFV
jgi:hypothetical protein